MSNPLDDPSIPTPQPTTPNPDTSSDSTSPHTLLAIEGPSSSTETEEKDDGTKVLDLGGGDIIKLDKLGPMIINSDGTLSRIQNWQDLHPIEQERTVRLLVKKRNLVRLRRLDADNKAEGKGDEENLTALTEAGGEAK
ncbi:hypothetical protein IAR55_005663 [Kwoniella newhampshirensis]|uniref:Uncharacterized protein n=1 Tax=Kwoniella newhampshirensis TaxID=1651941 RepID=A0AAW0YGH4_9TREE